MPHDTYRLERMAQLLADYDSAEDGADKQRPETDLMREFNLTVQDAREEYDT